MQIRLEKGGVRCERFAGEFVGQRTLAGAAEWSFSEHRLGAGASNSTETQACRHHTEVAEKPFCVCLCRCVPLKIFVYVFVFVCTGPMGTHRRHVLWAIEGSGINRESCSWSRLVSWTLGSTLGSHTGLLQSLMGSQPGKTCSHQRCIFTSYVKITISPTSTSTRSKSQEGKSTACIFLPLESLVLYI